MADVYRVGVAISLTNNVSSALKVIQRDVLGLGRTVDLTQGKFDRLKKAVVGAGAVFVGAAALRGFSALANAGGVLLDQQQRILAAGTTQADLAKEMATAYQMAAISGSDLAQNLKMVADLRSVLGYKNLGEAQALAPTMMRAGIAAGQLTGTDPEQAAYNIALIEDRLGYTLNAKTGKLDADRAGQMANLIDAIISGTNGRVDTRQLLNFSQRALASGKLLSTEGLVNLVPVIQAMGGDIAGTALTAYDKAVVGGVMTTRGTSWLQRLGLYHGNVRKEGSGYARIDPNQIAGSGLAALDPQTWSNQYLLPALQKAVGPKGTLQDMLKLISQSGLANTTVRFLSELVGSSVQNAKDVQNINVAAGSDQYSKMQQSLTGAEQNFTKALDGLWQALGVPAANAGVVILNTLSAGIRNFTQWVGAHPEMAKAMVYALGVLGVAITAFGVALTATAIGAMVGSGGTLALVAGGIAAIGVAVGGVIGVIHELPAAFEEVENAITGLLRILGISTGGRNYNLAHQEAAPPSLSSYRSVGLTPQGHTSQRMPPVHAANDEDGRVAIGRTANGHIIWGSAPQAAAAADEQHLAAVHAWIDNGAPVTVTNPTTDVNATVKNPSAFNAAAARHLKQQLSLPSYGASGNNLRATPSGSAALTARASGQ